MVQLIDITKIFRTDTVETTALNHINLQIGKGEFVGIKGPSGCGKSTLLNILGLMDKPTSGNLFINGKDTSLLKEKEQNQLRNHTIGFVFQKFNLIDSLTIFENVELPLLYLRQKADIRHKAVLEVLEQLELGHRTKHFPYQLSGGQQQRAAMARCVVSNPELILADEPTGNLDSENGMHVMNLLQQMNKNGKTIVMVTHDDTYAAFASRILHLFDGEIKDSGV
jgi:putative ABC transport system ATP-binding protein